MKARLIGNKAPHVYITKLAYNKMIQYTNNCNDEIGWLGTAIKEDDVYIIEDTFLFKQETHSTTAEITTEGLGEFAMDILQREDGMDIWNNMRVWGHSHVNMATSPSSQDDKQMLVFEESDHDFFIRIITNKKGDLRLDVYDYKLGIAYEELPYMILYDEKESERLNSINLMIARLTKEKEELTSITDLEIQQIKTEIKQKVTRKIYSTPSYGNQYAYGGYGNYWDRWEEQYYKYDAQTQAKVETQEEKMEIGDVKTYFDQLSEDNIFTLNMAIECDDILNDYLSDVELTYYEELELKNLIQEYVMDNEDKYEDWLFKEKGM